MTKARSHADAGEHSLALREFKEASRLRPRDKSARTEVKRLNDIVNISESPPSRVPSERISSIFNLSIRYWDRNMPSAALKEVLNSSPRNIQHS
jgi:hypothetical protein